MLEIVEKTLLTALGAASMTQKKVEEVVNELKERFNLTEEEGRRLKEKVKTAATERRDELQQEAAREVREAAERMGLVTKTELAALEARIAALEQSCCKQDA
ncbi:MAG: phasin family protein [Desulfuromonadaceae bacterium]|jgi:polyhydroxyalkanoate synthesis regulator phasin|nr:phasin family protein [Desulfuromonas sp.]MDY0185902.1 phasin family protein [Desulfuromonadaceae bacterium]